MSETIIAKNENYTITQEKRGEGTYGIVYSGYYKDDPTQPLAFKILKQQETVTGFTQQNNIREAVFLSEMGDLFDDQTSPFVPLIDVLIGETLQIYHSTDDLKNSIILVMPLYTTELSKLMYCKQIQRGGFQEVYILHSKLLSLVCKMHRLGYAHRDLKHNNVLVKQNWRFVLIDFGMLQFNPNLNVDESQIDDDQKEAVAFDPRSQALTALYWRPPEQIYSRAILQQSAELAPLLSLTKNGFYSDAYVLGCMMLELALGVILFRTSEKEENLGLEQLVAMQFYCNAEYCKPEVKRLLKKTLDTQTVLARLNEYNRSSFQDYMVAVSWCKLSFRKLILKCLLIRFLENLDQILFAKVKEMRDVICDLMEFDVLKRKTVVEVAQLYPDYFVEDETQFNDILQEKFGDITDNLDKHRSGFILQLEKFNQPQADTFILKRVYDIVSEELDAWLLLD